MHCLNRLVARSAIGIHNALYGFLSHELFQIAIYGCQCHGRAGLACALEQLLGAHGSARAYEQTPEYTLLTSLTLSGCGRIIHGGHFLWLLVDFKLFPFFSFMASHFLYLKPVDDYIMRDEY